MKKDAERITVASGQLTITRDLSQVSGTYEARSQAQRALADCEAALAKFNASGGKVNSYEIAGRRMQFSTIAELLQLQAFWKAKVLAEHPGQGSKSRNLYANFKRP
ncbi:MAG: hypothetical protein ACOZJZ_00005 [Pseudomonadota bacterium]